jgi:hypothetical protein
MRFLLFPFLFLGSLLPGFSQLTLIVEDEDGRELSLLEQKINQTKHVSGGVGNLDYNDAYGAFEPGTGSLSTMSLRFENVQETWGSFNWGTITDHDCLGPGVAIRLSFISGGSVVHVPLSYFTFSNQYPQSIELNGKATAHYGNDWSSYYPPMSDLIWGSASGGVVMPALQVSAYNTPYQANISSLVSGFTASRMGWPKAGSRHFYALRWDLPPQGRISTLPYSHFSSTFKKMVVGPWWGWSGQNIPLGNLQLPGSSFSYQNLSYIRLEQASVAYYARDKSGSGLKGRICPFTSSFGWRFPYVGTIRLRIPTVKKKATLKGDMPDTMVLMEGYRGIFPLDFSLREK